ncbi:MAG: hypothetical protein SOZ18_01445 [Phocaeicola sp.]|nr:hypothetical protein [Phocaeicola sp.]
MEEGKLLLQNFEGKLRHFIYLYEQQKKEIASLQSLLEEKETDIKRLKEELETLESQYTYLKMACALGHKEDVQEAKKRINHLVREVDKCIALLSD